MFGLQAEQMPVFTQHLEIHMLTQAKVKKLFDYDLETGLLTWLTKLGRRTHIGGGAGCLNRHGYLLVGIEKKLYYVHRIIYLWFYGKFPDHELDHINHDPSDNRISNLREVTHKENGRNHSMNKNNTSGVTGVSWSKQSKKWVAQITVDGRNINLGLFVDKDEAIATRRLAEGKHGFHLNHGKGRTI